MTRSRNILAPKRFWTDDEVAILRERYPDMRTEDLALEMGRTARQVYQAANNRGLTKSHAFRSSQASGRWKRGHHSGRTTQFPKGHVPANKGTRRPGYAPGRMKASQFPKGHRPHTWKPVGHLRVNADGYLDRKITDDGPPQRHWRAVHRLVWEQAKGPVPRGHVVVFKPGRRTTNVEAITLDAVELIDRRELMRRNTVHNYPHPIPQLVQLRGVLIRKINKRTRKHEDQDHRPA